MYPNVNETCLYLGYKLGPKKNCPWSYMYLCSRYITLEKYTHTSTLDDDLIRDQNTKINPLFRNQLSFSSGLRSSSKLKRFAELNMVA